MGKPLKCSKAFGVINQSLQILFYILPYKDRDQDNFSKAGIVQSRKF